MSSVFVARTERTGSLFARITGLLRTGQMKWEDRPLWYDVYVGFPPAHEPIWDIKMPKREEPVPKIFYEEDTALARFYQEFDAPSVIDLSAEKADSICGHFLRQYRLTREACPELSPDAVFSRAISEIKISREAANTHKKQ